MTGAVGVGAGGGVSWTPSVNAQVQKVGRVETVVSEPVHSVPQHSLPVRHRRRSQVKQV